MLYNNNNRYELYPFSSEKEFENSVNEIKQTLFGDNRIYLDDKRKIGAKGKTNNLPDGYLIDFLNEEEPKIFVVENELERHHHLKHIAIQILEFSLSYDSSKQRVKNHIKEMLKTRPDELKKLVDFVIQNKYENLDYFLESVIYKKESFNALLIIDQLSEELETVLMSKFNFPVELITLKRYKNQNGEILYEFDPFLYEIQEDTQQINVSDIDTIVVPAHEEGFQETFIGENRWYSIRIHSSMKPKIKYIASYRVSPISAITHIAEVKSIEQWKDTNKYVLNFTEPAREIKKVSLGNVSSKAPQAPRYSSKDQILQAKTLDDVF